MSMDIIHTLCGKCIYGVECLQPEFLTILSCKGFKSKGVGTGIEEEELC